MEIIYRNFMRLMSAGAFSTECTIEPMSRYKWGQLLALSDTYGVADYVSAGIIGISTSDSQKIPKDIAEAAYAKYNALTADKPTAQQVVDFTSNSSDMFANLHLRHKLKALVYNEIHSIDTSTASLSLLYKIIENGNAIIYGNIDYRLMIDLGRYLRNNGDKIDFVKLELWLRSLGLNKPANLIGSYLISVFGFVESEVQFLSKKDCDAYKKAVKPLRYTLNRASEEYDIRDYQDKLNDKLHIPDSRILSRISFFPSEVTCKFFSGIVKSLSNIEE